VAGEGVLGNHGAHAAIAAVFDARVIFDRCVGTTTVLTAMA
jgi:hypothetical protein